MWETFISWYINNYLGKYVENLNSQQLSVALGRGELELENVPLKRNIFRSWGLPIQVKASVVGRIRIEFNILKYFRNEPVLISIEDVFLVAGPIELSELDPLEEEALAQESKMSALDAHEGRWKAQFDLQNNSSSYYSSFYASSMRVGASIVTKVVENLQLNVKNVHVRFEYESSGRVVAFGVTLAGLSVQSCDGKWVPLSSGGVAALGDLSFKTLKMNKLGVYCDTRAERMSELGVEELRAAMTKPLASSVYILSPVSPEARVTKNNSTAPLSSSSKPRFDVHLTLDKVPLQLSESQYKYSFRLYKSIRKLNRNVRLRHYRPFGSVSKENVKEWWRHATQAVLTLRGFKRRNKLTSWEAVLARAKENCLYVQTYQQHLTDEVLSGEARKLKDHVEFELHFDDIVELRRIAMRKVEALYSDLATPQPQPSTAQTSSSSTEGVTTEGELPARQSGSGVISWFFPSWSSWYSQVPATEQQNESFQDANSSISARDSTLSVGDRTISESEFEEEILGEMRAFGRDVLLARFSFTLNQGAVLLNKKNTSFLDLSFDGVSVELSLKPRFGSHKFQMRLSSLLLKDSVTQSAVLCPHASSISSMYLTKTTPTSVDKGPLFSLVYEMNPNKNAGHRISVTTRPMDLIIYPTTWDEVGDFFSVKVEDYLETPYNGYEAMKQKTKEELQVYWERLIHSKSSTDNGNGESWDIYMDIFAPQITIYGYQTERNQKGVGTKDQGRQDPHIPPRFMSHQPEGKKCFPEELPSPSAVIIDLGRFKFSNLEETVQSPTGLLSEDVKDGCKKEDEEDEDEEFLTPCSSPVPEKFNSTVSSPRRSASDISEQTPMSHKEALESFGDSLDEIQSKFYKKYSLEITDVQVLVLDRKCNSMRGASFKVLRGTSMMHFVDKFSINLQLERRLVYSEDPLWPALTLVGTLPNLTFHLNESKILTLRSVFNAVTSPAVKNPLEPFDLSFQSGSKINIPDADRSEIRLNDTLTDSPAFASVTKPSGKLFVAEFTIHNVSVDLQARDRNIAELQIVGTKTVLTHRECDTEFNFVIQSLLLADAVQTFGPDYQLLLASYKPVCMDSVSANLLDSEPTPPTSPPSPIPPVMGVGHALRPCPGSLEIPTHTQLHHALMNSLQLKKKKLLSSVKCQTPVPGSGSDALIIIDVTLTKREEDMAIVTVQFNELDMIANQETVGEIMQFFHAILPRSKSDGSVQSKLSDTSIIPHDAGKKVLANFEFHRLNVLLLRGVVGKDGCQVARKIATVTASNARVNCSLQNFKLNVDGSLGGIQVLNLTPEGQRHQRILSVGQDPLVDASENPFNTEANLNVPLQSAFSFRYEKSDSDTGAKLSIRMASVIYSHCSLFVMDLMKCVNQFQVGGLSSPVTVSTGIVTKRAPVLEVPDSVFELKVHISNCELVAVERDSVCDTNALILKASVAFGYRPHLERLLTCNILQCELFSCTLGLESETALSILDPTNIHFDVVRRQTEQESQGILDAMSLATCGKVLKIQSPSLNLRLSYYDMRMFLRFIEKFSKDAQSHFSNKDVPAEADLEVAADDLENLPRSLDIDRLVIMGFSHEVAVHALEETQGSFEDAVYLLTNAAGFTSLSEQNRNSQKSRSKAGSLKSLSLDDQGSYSSDSSSIQGIEIKCNCLSLCVIDDCKDSDVPVVEMSVQQLDLFQNCIENVTCADCILTGDYYNRTLSGWEPFLEPWKCSVKWRKNLLGQLDDYSPSREFPSRAPEYEVYISSNSLLDLNITSTLLQLYKTVSDNWTEDYQEHQHKGDKRRAPFVPFALKNETGSRLWFCTIISNSEEVFRQQQKGNAGHSRSDTTGWIEVKHGATQNFSFEGRGKLRHRNTHQLKTHQLAVKVDGWNEVTPVSVDRVGTYFRVAKPEEKERRGGGHERRYGSYMELPPTRLVLEVSLQGSAQKVVTVRSALMIKNALPEPVELKLENTIVYPSFERAQTGGPLIVQIQPGCTYPVPLHSVWAHMWVRPVIPEEYPLLYLYCSKALLIGSSQDQEEGLRECATRSQELAVVPYRFCVAVKRNEFPADSDEIIPRNSLPNIIQLMRMSNRANLITLLSPFKLNNLLPHEVSFKIVGKNCSGRIGPGKTQCMSGIDTNEPLELHYQVDNFPQGVTVSVNSKSNSSVQRVKIQDTMKRTLVLTVKVLKEESGVLSIHLCCPCWVVNKSGLPLLCKQEGTSGEAAGQFQEHEVGRMITPLMMSFADAEGTEALTLRVGTGLHKESKPFWCRSFLCQNGLRVRKLTVSHCNNSPESVYMVGVEIKNGTGRYSDTKLVVVSPRFVVDNRSQYKIQISQWAYANSFFDAKAEKTHLTLPPGCNLPFHWPRLDREQLLCVRLKDEVERGVGNSGGHWSGGFPVDNVDSFFINIRDTNGSCLFLRVEIVLQGPSYFVIFTDTTQLPPPFRIDNFTLVSLIFHQACLTEERLKLTARAECSIPYALDEPTKAPHLTVTAPGGSSLIVNMDDLRFVSQLTYENFFYIAFTATFPGGSGNSVAAVKFSGMESLELVLDVEGTRVFLGKKEQGKRSQLWRVNADGLIEHDGSSPPRDLSKRQESQYTSSTTMLVLDIAGPAPVPSQCVPLMLRKPDRRRISTQHWEFTNDGRMKCRMYEGLYVQAKDGFGTFGSDQQQQQESEHRQGGSGSWQKWSDVVLGPSQPLCYIRTDSGIPAEQAVARQKLRPGSGILNLNVETDGPTRVLRIVDVEHPPRHHLLRHTFEENDVNTTPKYRVKVDLPVGVGISIVSCTPTREELMYGRLLGLSLGITDTPNSQVLEAVVMNLQLDNQLLESEKTAVIYIPSSSRSPDSFLSEEDEEDKHLPALHFYSESLKSNLNTRVYKIWELVIKPISLIVEERLLLKLYRWLGKGQQVQSLDMLQQSDFEVQKALTSTANYDTRRYYFGCLKVVLDQVKLSVLTASSKLPPDLLSLKRRLGLTLIRFEDANVDLDPFEKHHPFETFEFLWALVVKHYRDELVSQAAVILGSTDFLGNPLGFVNDVSEGVSLMIYEGSVGALVKNVAHGLSNSAAKVTGTLGEGLGKTILDDRHEKERRRIKEDHAGSSGEHLYAGLKGFCHGLIGGITSVASQSYEGVSNEGFTGLFTGFTKGVVGTFTKPAVGLLDFATGAASAIRDSSKTSSRMIPHRMRPTRVVVGNGGLLPIYSEPTAFGQELLFKLNDRNYNELFIACETLKSNTEQQQELRIMISSSAVTVFRSGKGNPVILRIPMGELLETQLAPSVGDRERTPYIEFVRQLPDLLAPCRPQVICEHEVVAKRVVQQVNYAKVLFEEMRHSQIGTGLRGSGEEVEEE